MEQIVDFMSGLDQRELDILLLRIVADKPKTLEQIGSSYGLTRERIRQIERGLREPLERLGNELAGAIGLLREAVGTAALTDDEEMRSALTRLRGDLDEAQGRPVDMILLYFAGPYRVINGWMVAETLDQDRMIAELRSLCDSSRVLELDPAVQCLKRYGLRADLAPLWMQTLEQFRRYGEGWIRWDGSTLTRLERLLRASGMPGTAEDLLAEAGLAHVSRGVRDRMNGDPRFVSINLQGHFAVPEWGFDEYTGITDEIIQEIDRCGGFATLGHLVLVLSTTYGIAGNSIRSYVGTPCFVREGGKVRVRGDDEPISGTDPDISSHADCFFMDGHWNLRLVVDHDVLRGSGRSIPEGFAAELGVRAGDKRSVPVSSGNPVTMSWPMTSIRGPSIGSLRRVATELGAAQNDLLWLAVVDGVLHPRLTRGGGGGGGAEAKGRPKISTP